MCETDTALTAAATWVLAWLWASASAWCWQPPQAVRADAVLSQGLSVMPSMVHVCMTSSAFQAWADFSLFMVLLPRDAPLMVALGVPATSCCSHPKPLGGAGVTVLQAAPAPAAAVGCKYHSCSLGGCLMKVSSPRCQAEHGKVLHSNHETAARRWGCVAADAQADAGDGGSRRGTEHAHVLHRAPSPPPLALVCNMTSSAAENTGDEITRYKSRPGRLGNHYFLLFFIACVKKPGQEPRCEAASCRGWRLCCG